MIIEGLILIIQSNFRSSQKKQDWNAIVRSSTIRGDPIGSTSEVVERRKRQSLKRQIIANANEGLSMNTTDLVGELEKQKFLVRFLNETFRLIRFES